jgi:hypothetical protein
VKVETDREKKSGPPQRPQTFDDAHAAAMKAIGELETKQGITADDRKAIDTLREIATLSKTLIVAYKDSWRPGTFMVNPLNVSNLTKISQHFSAFDEKTWAPKVVSDNQAQVAHIYSEFIRDMRDIIRLDDKKPEKDPTRLFSAPKMEFLKQNQVVETLMTMANTASENRSNFRSAQREQQSASRQQEEPKAGSSKPNQSWARPNREPAPAATAADEKTADTGPKITFGKK